MRVYSTLPKISNSDYFGKNSRSYGLPAERSRCRFKRHFTVHVLQLAVAACLANVALAIHERTVLELGPREDCVRMLLTELAKVDAFGDLHADTLMLLLQVSFAFVVNMNDRRPSHCSGATRSRSPWRSRWVARRSPAA